MAEQKFDNKKFSPFELFNNSNGQTTVALLIAFIIALCGCAGFAYAMFAKPETLIHVISFTGLGTAILLGRNLKDSFTKKDG